MTSSLGSAAFGSSVLLAIVSACAVAHSRPQDECIEIRHVGEQDKPLPGLRMCIGDKGKARLEKGYAWTFWFEAPIFRALEKYVESHRPQANSNDDDSRVHEFGTFRITWGQQSHGDKYLLAPKGACAYFADVNRICEKGQNPDCTQAIGDLMRRLRCR